MEKNHVCIHSGLSWHLISNGYVYISINNKYILIYMSTTLTGNWWKITLASWLLGFEHEVMRSKELICHFFPCRRKYNTNSDLRCFKTVQLITMIEGSRKEIKSEQRYLSPNLPALWIKHHIFIWNRLVLIRKCTKSWLPLIYFKYY